MKKLLTVILVLCVLIPAGAALAEDKVIYVYNWYDYIDESVLEQFEQETGIRVEYTCFTTNEDMIIELEVNPSGYDVVFPSDYIVERMIGRDMLAPLDWSKLPNAKAYTRDKLLNPSYDPQNAYSVPYMWGTLGILYNTTMVDEADEVDSWEILWNTKYKNNVFMLDSIRDTMCVALALLGYDINTTDRAELEAARDKLIEQKQLGMVRAYQVDQIKDRMVAGDAALAVMWSGDAEYAVELNEDLAYVIPWQGSNIWVDPMVVPKNAPHYDYAMQFIDFLCRPDIAQKNCEEIGYCSPNTGAVELMGEEYQQNEILNPTDEDVELCDYFHDIPAEHLDTWNWVWNAVKSAH